MCRRLTPWFWVVIQRRHGNMETHWSTTWNWSVIIICRWKVVLLWPNFNLWTKFTDQDDSIVFVHYLFLFSSKTIVFCRKVSFEQNCPRFAIGNENFFILWETYLNPDVYYHYYYFNPFVFMGNGTKTENQVDIFQKKVNKILFKTKISRSPGLTQSIVIGELSEWRVFFTITLH